MNKFFKPSTIVNTLGIFFAIWFMANSPRDIENTIYQFNFKIEHSGTSNLVDGDQKIGYIRFEPEGKIIINVFDCAIGASRQIRLVVGTSPQQIVQRETSNFPIFINLDQPLDVNSNVSLEIR